MFSSERLPLAERFASLLAGAGVERGLIGPREVPRLWERHLLNCAALAPSLPAGCRVADVGSGAGLPGVVLALARPDLRVTLVEPLHRRVVFLEEVLGELGLAESGTDGGLVTVVRARAEQLHGQRRFDVVTSRAVAPLARLLGWCMPLVEPEGYALAMKGASAAAEVAAERAWVGRQGWSDPEVVEHSSADGAVVRAVRVRWADPARVSWPTNTPPGARRSGRGDRGSPRRGRR